MKLEKGNVVKITESLKEAFSMNGWDSYMPEVHDKLQGQYGEITSIEEKYSQNYCYVKVFNFPDFSGTMPVRALTKIFIPDDKLAQDIAKLVNEKNPQYMTPRAVQEWFINDLSEDSIEIPHKKLESHKTLDAYILLSEGWLSLDKLPEHISFRCIIKFLELNMNGTNHVSTGRYWHKDKVFSIDDTEMSKLTPIEWISFDNID